MSLTDAPSSPNRKLETLENEQSRVDVVPPSIASPNLDDGVDEHTVMNNAVYDDLQALERSSAAAGPTPREIPTGDEPLIDLATEETNLRPESESDAQSIMDAPVHAAQSVETPLQASNSVNETLKALSLNDKPIESSAESRLSSTEVPSSSPPHPLPKDDKYLRQPSPSIPTSRKASPKPPGSGNAQGDEWNEKEAYADKTQHINAVEHDFNEKPREGENNEDTTGEISTIIQQFTGDKPANMGISSPTTRDMSVFQYPPRSSSLAQLTQAAPGAAAQESEESTAPVSPPPRDSDRASISYAGSIRSQAAPPEPDPEPDLPFDFHRFLEQLRHRTADPVAKFLRSFLQEFGKKQWQVHEQVKIVSDFLTFISNRMAQCDVWRNVSDAEFDNAREGMEKLVMNRLYTQTFSPEIPPSEPSPVKGRRKGTSTPLNSGRKGQHQEDVERDEVLAQKIRIYGWLREEHLDMKPFGDKGRKFLSLAQQELSKIKSYRAPRDKIICVLNCCKVIFGYLKNSQADQSADTFIPLLIYTVLKADPDHLVSNLQYISRFRNQEKLGGEAGYYLSSLMGAVQFIETLDRTNLTVSDEEFDKNVEAAVSEIAAHNEQEEKRNSPLPPTTMPPPHLPEKSAPSRPEVTPRHSMDGERTNQKRSTVTTSSEEQQSEEKAAVSGLLRSIQRPLSTIGRIFSDESTPTISTSSHNNTADRPPVTPQPPSRPGRPSAAPPNYAMPPGAAAAEQRTRLRDEDAAALQASAELAEAHDIMRAEHHTVVETLAGMFPDLDPEIISDVVRMKEGRIGLAVDACLALSR